MFNTVRLIHTYFDLETVNSCWCGSSVGDDFIDVQEVLLIVNRRSVTLCIVKYT